MAGKVTLIVLVSLWLAALNFIAPTVVAAFDEMTAPAVSPAEELGVSGPNDFVQFWAMGRLAAAGRAAEGYDLRDMFSAERLDARAPGLQLPWVYPPPAILLTVPLRNLPFPVAFGLWSVVLSALAVLLLRIGGLPWPVVCAGCLSPAALLNLGLGQLGLLLGATVWAALALAPRRPLQAGALFGLLAVKPQTALLAPLVFLHGRRRTGLAGGLATALTLCVLATLAYGTGIWRVFIGTGLPVAHDMVTRPFPAGPGPQISSYEYYGISVFWMLRSFRLGLAVSMAGQGAAALAAAICCWRLWRPGMAEGPARIALTICLGLIATPYGYLYDLCGASIGIAALAWHQRRLVLSDILLWTWPVTGLIISRRFGLELAPLVLALACWRCTMAGAFTAPGTPRPSWPGRSSPR